MPLTGAERMKRYREKLKADPEKYIEVKKKHAQLVKNKTKKISELNDEEKQKLRKKWREQKRNKKKEVQHQASKTQEKKEKTRKAPNKSRIVRQYKAALEKINALVKTLQATKKKFYRYKVKTSEEIEQLQECVTKMKIREEVLEHCLKSTYSKCHTQKEKRLLKDLVDNEKVTDAKMKTKCSNLLGLKGKIRKSKKRVKNIKTSLDIREFYMRDDVSRCTAGKRECRTLGKKKEQIRYLMDTLQVLYEKYKLEGGKQSFSTFYRYKPFFVLSPNVKNRDTCLCVKHSNIELKLYTLQKKGLLTNYKSMTDILRLLSCDLNSHDCMFSKCQKCNEIKLDYPLENMHKDTNVEWFQWERIDHTYEKNEKGTITTATTKKTAKVKKTGTIHALIKSFEVDIPAFKKHYFTWIHQQRQYQKCINEMKETEALIICDFSENYQCKLASEIQSMHFGASKLQITLHTGMIYMKSNCQSFCTVSDSTCHEPQAIWAHLIPVIKMLREIKPDTKVIHFFSDGPSSQYRQKKNFFLHNLFSCKLGLNFSTWSFTESGHGKGVADGIGGAVKRALDRQVSYGRDISNAKEAHEALQNCMKTVKCLLINDKDIENIDKIIPNNLKTVPGTMHIHQITSSCPGVIVHRTHSCFCTSERGMGGCYSPQKYSFNVNNNENKQKRQDEMRDVIENSVRNANMKINKMEDKILAKNEQDNMVEIIRSDEVTEGRQDERIFETRGSHDVNLSQIMHKYKEGDQTTNERNCEMRDSVIVIDPTDEWGDKVIVKMNDELGLSDDMVVIKLDQKEQINEEYGVSRENTILQDKMMNYSKSEFVVLCDKKFNSTENISLEVKIPPQNMSQVENLDSSPHKTKIQSECYEIQEHENSTDNAIDSFQPLSQKLKRKFHASSQFDSHNRRSYILESKNYKANYVSQPKKSEVASFAIKKENRALRTIIKRKIKCHICKTEFPFQTCTAKCMACKELICLSCSRGQQMFDYICDTCLGE